LHLPDRSTNIRVMPTKNRPPRARVCPIAKARLRQVYEQWQAGERQAGRAASLAGFASALGYESHSAVGDMLNGKRALAADVVRAARARWDINPSWLLGFDGPMYGYEVVATGTLEAMLAERVRAEVEARVRESPVAGALTDATGPLVATPASGAQLLAFAVAAAERALRASYPVEEQRSAAALALAAAHQAMAVYPAMRGRAALERAAAVLPTAMPAPSDVPMADDPPVRFTVAATRTPRD
jgi:hypothetical protein